MDVRYSQTEQVQTFYVDQCEEERSELGHLT